MSNSSDVGPCGLNPTGGFALPDVDALDAAAKSLRQHADDFLSGVATSTAVWRGLSSSYSSDESHTVLAAFGTIMPSAQRVQGTAVSTSAALTAFSSTCRDLKLRLEAYARKVHALNADIGAFPTSVEKVSVVKDEVITTRVSQHWSGEADLTARHDTLAAEVKAIHDDYLAAQNACAGALSSVSGGETYSASRPTGPDLKSGNPVDEALWNAGTFLGIEHPQEEQPWGKATVPYRPNGTLGLLQGFGAGAIELIDGVLTISGLSGNDLKEQQAWAGMGATVGALGTLAMTPLSLWDEERKQREAPDVQKALDLFGSMGPAFIHADEADTNANWAAGATVFNIASIAASYGAGAAVKSGALASKAGSLAERLSVATVQRTGLGNLSAMLGTTANGLNTTAVFLAKPGSLTLKISDILMPNTTAKVINTTAQARHAAWTAITVATTTTVEAAGGVKRVVAGGLERLADGVRSVESGIPAVLTPDPSGVMTRTTIDTGFPDRLDNTAAGIRQNNPPAVTPPKAPAADTSVPTAATTMAERFPKPDNVTNTVVYRHGDSAFPIHRKENFAARTTLKPNTEYIIEHRGVMRDSTGALKENTIEKYYTDDTGTVTRVDTYAGVKGAWSPELNKPMPNITYNVVAQVDGGLQNTFTLKMDSNGHLESAKGHIVSTLVGDANRNGWQQRKAGWLGGPGYDGGHAGPSFLGFIGERGGLFPQHEWQNRKAGTPNDLRKNNFHDTEMEVINKVKKALGAGSPVDLTWEMRMLPGIKAGLPSKLELEYRFGQGRATFRTFNN
ncbi:DNA/RNA non-specific endonuclease [Paenarthrobacter sp. TYUT067]|uniref:DNA/RNA non-specific endonuclease n=1 Tax=Paenarthrobacter sp. TYUT067 TaxID=2926245 RepID=UPI00202E3902|nr:DNA/RNA non-specific endonuclease [Paenarthrobacter sp. TYUT067]MCM0618341.1 DNA/RNA non-specific endonuclease [Paenarthrobacter sp. TYUT067]